MRKKVRDMLKISDKLLMKFENERELLIYIALKMCSRCKTPCTRRDYCDKIINTYKKYVRKWRQIKKQI